MFKIEPNYDFVKNEKEVLKYWEEHQCFKKLLRKIRKVRSIALSMVQLQPIIPWVCIMYGEEP